jgi:hypothetical protein
VRIGFVPFAAHRSVWNSLNRETNGRTQTNNSHKRTKIATNTKEWGDR